jgi:hypothetical protein
MIGTRYLVRILEWHIHLHHPVSQFSTEKPSYKRKSYAQVGMPMRTASYRMTHKAIEV